MSTIPVLPYPTHYPLRHLLSREFIINDLGDGYVQTITQEGPYYRADGMKGISTHYGCNHFFISFNRAMSGASQIAFVLWDFFRKRLENGNESFYFYNPAETLVIDTSGSSATGRYLVRLADPNQVLNRTYYAYNLFRYGGIELVEEREERSLSSAIL